MVKIDTLPQFVNITAAFVKKERTYTFAVYAHAQAQARMHVPKGRKA